MATLEKIRSKGGLLVLVIGLALLAFLVGDFFSSGATLFGSSRENIAEVNGEKIHIFEFQKRIDQITEVYKLEFGEKSLNDELNTYIRTSEWTNMLNEILIQEEAEKLGLTVTKEELSDRLIGNNIHPIIMQRPMFQGQTGQFDKNVLLDFYGQISQDGLDAQTEAMLAPYRNYWLYWENYVKNTLLQEKYSNLLSQSVVANSIDAKSAFEARTKTVDMQYIQQYYSILPDSIVSVSNSEIKERYNKTKEQKFKQDESRGANYVVFEVKPLDDDYAQVQEWMNRLSQEFLTTNDIVGLVNENSDVFYDASFVYSERNTPEVLKDFAFSGKVGDYYGPVFHDDTHTMARIMETGISRPDSVKLSHIVLAPTDEARADSIVNVLRTNRNADFAELARQFSRVATAQSGGDAGWLVDGIKGVDKEFLAAFDKKVNDIFVINKPQLGLQIVKVTEKTKDIPKVKLAILERKVTPSSRTQGRIFNDAKQFAVAAKTPDTFQEQADERSLVVRYAGSIKKNDDRMGVIARSRDIVKWAYAAKQNQVSDVFDLGDQFVVAILTEIDAEGYMPLEKATPQIKEEITQEKKADYMVKDIKEKMASVSSISELADRLSTSVKDVYGLSFSSTSINGISDNYVIGKAMVSPLNTISQPVKGNTSAYVLYPIKTAENAGQAFDAQQEKNTLTGNYSSSMYYKISADLNEKADIKDNRSVFY